MTLNPWPLLVYVIGLFVIMAAILDWNWFFEHPRAKFFVAVLGRGGARIFYAILGCAILVLGFLFAAG